MNIGEIQSFGDLFYFIKDALRVQWKPALIGVILFALILIAVSP